jgi:hypothetical protein
VTWSEADANASEQAVACDADSATAAWEEEATGTHRECQTSEYDGSAQDVEHLGSGVFEWVSLATLICTIKHHQDFKG